MKRTGWLFVAVVLSLMSLGVGYAAWQDNLQVTTTVGTASWTMDDDGGIPESGPGAPDSDDGDITGITQDGFDVTFNNMYPGDLRTITFVFANTLTLPIEMYSINVADQVITSNPALADFIMPLSGGAADNMEVSVKLNGGDIIGTHIAPGASPVVTMTFMIPTGVVDTMNMSNLHFHVDLNYQSTAP